MRSPPLEPRRAPKQERGQATVDAILEATAALLAERGFEGVNTNAVAARAGVKPPAVYRYFPNKFALYHGLAAKLQGEIDTLLDRVLVDADAGPLDALVGRILDVGAKFYTAHPAFGALWTGSWAMEGSPPPALTFGERTLARLKGATNRFRHLGEPEETVALTAALHIAMALLGLAVALPEPFRAAAIAEAKLAVTAYLRTKER